MLAGKPRGTCAHAHVFDVIEPIDGACIVTVNQVLDAFDALGGMKRGQAHGSLEASAWQ